MTLVKICGMRTAEDLEAARRADFVGFIVETDSPRCLDIRQAGLLMSRANNGKVLVSACRDIDRLMELCNILEPDVLQTHSSLPLDGLMRLRRELDVELWSLFSVKEPLDHARLLSLAKVVDKVHLDTPSGSGGGSGRTHDWTLSRVAAETISPRGVVLAGGLRPDNVAAAVEAVHPDVVDVASGVEMEDRKSLQRIEDFIENARKV